MAFVVLNTISSNARQWYLSSLTDILFGRVLMFSNRKIFQKRELVQYFYCDKEKELNYIDFSS